MLNYSKALRGLSVLSRVMCIFTHTTISPGPLLRQYPNRYTIRAGRNLPDKEFRYHSEGTFGRLRYSFGGDRPSQTAHLTLFLCRITATG